MNSQFRHRAGHIKFEAVCKNCLGIEVHRAFEVIQVYQCLDEGKELSIQPENNIFSFCSFKQYFTFTDAQSQQIFEEKFETFKNSNKIGASQTYFHTVHMKISGFKPKIGLSKTGTDYHTALLYIIFTFLGFLYPISFMI